MSGGHHRCIYAHAPKRDPTHQGAGKQDLLHLDVCRPPESTTGTQTSSADKHIFARNVRHYICLIGHSMPLLFAQIKRIIHLEVQSKPMYLRTLLYALRQGVALDSGEPAPTSALSSVAPTAGVGQGADASSTDHAPVSSDSADGKVPDRLLDLYLSSQDSISLTSKVLDVYAAYVDEGEVSPRKPTNTAQQCAPPVSGVFIVRAIPENTKFPATSSPHSNTPQNGTRSNKIAFRLVDHGHL